MTKQPYITPKYDVTLYRQRILQFEVDLLGQIKVTLGDQSHPADQSHPRQRPNNNRFFRDIIREAAFAAPAQFPTSDHCCTGGASCFILLFHLLSLKQALLPEP